MSTPTLEASALPAATAAEAPAVDSRHICDVCGRPLAPRKGTRGRHKERHKDCSLLESRLNEVDDLLRTMAFGDVEHAKALRSRLFNMVNHNLRTTVVEKRLLPECEDDLDGRALEAARMAARHAAQAQAEAAAEARRRARLGLDD